MVNKGFFAIKGRGTRRPRPCVQGRGNKRLPIRRERSSLSPFFTGEGWGERPLSVYEIVDIPVPPHPPRSARRPLPASGTRLRSNQALTPTPIGHDTPVPPNPQ